MLDNVRVCVIVVFKFDSRDWIRMPRARSRWRRFAIGWVDPRPRNGASKQSRAGAGKWHRACKNGNIRLGACPRGPLLVLCRVWIWGLFRWPFLPALSAFGWPLLGLAPKIEVAAGAHKSQQGRPLYINKTGLIIPNSTSPCMVPYRAEQYTRSFRR